LKLWRRKLKGYSDLEEYKVHTEKKSGPKMEFFVSLTKTRRETLVKEQQQCPKEKNRAEMWGGIKEKRKEKETIYP